MLMRTARKRVKADDQDQPANSLKRRMVTRAGRQEVVEVEGEIGVLAARLQMVNMQRLRAVAAEKARDTTPRAVALERLRANSQPVCR